MEWFKPDLLLMDNHECCLFWMENYEKFILELQMNFGPYNPIRELEHQFDHLTMKDGQYINKYVVKFNWITIQVQSYEEGALWHHFYNSLSDCINDKVSYMSYPQHCIKFNSGSLLSYPPTLEHFHPSSS